MNEVGTIYGMIIDDLNSYCLLDFLTAARPTASLGWFGGWEVQCMLILTWERR